jgi:hypothetical protein
MILSHLVPEEDNISQDISDLVPEEDNISQDIINFPVKRFGVGVKK